MDKKLDAIETLLLTVLTKIETLGHSIDNINEHSIKVQDRIITFEKDLYRMKLQRTMPTPVPYKILHSHTPHSLPVLNPHFQQQHLFTSPYHHGTSQRFQHTRIHSSSVAKPAPMNSEPPVAVAPIITSPRHDHQMNASCDMATGSCNNEASHDDSWTDIDSDDEPCHQPKTSPKVVAPLQPASIDITYTDQIPQTLPKLKTDVVQSNDLTALIDSLTQYTSLNNTVDTSSIHQLHPDFTSHSVPTCHNPPTSSNPPNRNSHSRYSLTRYSSPTRYNLPIRHNTPGGWITTATRCNSSTRYRSPTRYKSPTRYRSPTRYMSPTRHNP